MKNKPYTVAWFSALGLSLGLTFGAVLVRPALAAPEAKADQVVDAKSGDPKSGDAKSGAAKSGAAKSGDAKATENKTSEKKQAEKAPVPEVKSTKPLIGVNCDVSGEKPKEIGVAAPYLDAISKAGGVPILLPPMAPEDISRVLPMLDGVMMIGGDDYPPSLYGEKEHASVSLMAKERSDFDIALVKAVLADKNLPFLGICAGCQALNIGSGGSLIQDIPSEKPGSRLVHASKNGYQSGFNSHPVTFVKGSKLQRIYGKEVITEPTSHHQAVSKPGAGINVCASADDGIVEAIEVAGRPFAFGVQFHPERAFDRNKALFDEFISTALSRRSARQAAH